MDSLAEKVISIKKEIRKSEQISVLMVEDNREDQRFIIEGLEYPEGIMTPLPPKVTVCVASTLKEATNKLLNNIYDIILLDLTLPDAKNLEGLHLLRERYPELPIVIHSGYYSHQLAQEAIRAGAQDYIVKGTMSREEVIRALLRAKWVFDHGQRELYRLRRALSH